MKRANFVGAYIQVATCDRKDPKRLNPKARKVDIGVQPHDYFDITKQNVAHSPFKEAYLYGSNLDKNFHTLHKWGTPEYKANLLKYLKNLLQQKPTRITPPERKAISEAVSVLEPHKAPSK